MLLLPAPSARAGLKIRSFDKPNLDGTLPPPW